MLLKLDKILFILSCTYLLSVIGWVWSRNLSTQKPDHDLEFIAYIHDALVKIERQQPLEPLTEAIAQQPEVTTSKEWERVYIPMYQPPKIITQAPPPVSEVIPPPPPPVVAPEPVFSSVPSESLNCTLVGLLQSEQGAIALFSRDGLTERVEIGQEIVGTGWILQDIVDNHALVQQNNQVKTIFVGQTF